MTPAGNGFKSRQAQNSGINTMRLIQPAPIGKKAVALSAPAAIATAARSRKYLLRHSPYIKAAFRRPTGCEAEAENRLSNETPLVV